MTVQSDPAPFATRRVRTLVAWLLTALVVLGYALAGEGPEDDERARHMLAGEHVASDRLDILEVEPTEATPGRAIEVRVIGAQTGPGAPELMAVLSQKALGGGKARFELLNQRDDLLVLRVPQGAQAGPAKLRLFQGDRKSKPYDLRIEPVNRRKVFRSIVGGLALLLFGLTTLSSGARAYAGRSTRGLVARISGRTPLALGLGVLLGGITQFTTTAAGLVVGLIDSHLLAVAPAAAILLGAQIGAAATPSVLGLASTREGLVVAAVGVIWLALARDRRGRAIGQLILGCGLLFYGLHVLRIGFEPLVSDPDLLPHIELFNAGSFAGLLACAGAGVLLAAVLQSPAPVFVIVLGLAEATGRLDLQSALAILAGTGLGAAAGTAIVAWPFGAEPRKLARLHLVLGALGTLLLIATVNFWSFLADALISGSPEQLAYGKKVLLPNLGRHLVLAFVLSQVAVNGALAALLPSVQRGLERLRENARVPAALQRARISSVPPPVHDAHALRASLANVLATQQRALEGVLELCVSGERTRATRSEHALSDARAELEKLFVAVTQRGHGGARGVVRKAVVATLALQRSTEELLRQAESGVERRFELSEGADDWQLAPRDANALRAMHALLVEGVANAAQDLRAGEAPDLDQARAREIRLNALELETRRGLLSADSASAMSAVALRLTASDLINAYESVGNHLYRLCEALAAEVDQDQDTLPRPNDADPIAQSSSPPRPK
jgi:Na+/phosphate symporter